MSNTFPHTRNSVRGYSVDQVEDFLEDARRAYTSEPGAPVSVSAASIRQMAFDMQTGGYAPAQVDAALERLEDAFANRERERALQQRGDQAWYAEARTIAQEILTRLARAPGHRFDRVSFLTAGYNHKDVDAFSKRLTSFFQEGKPLSVDEVRTIAFRPQNGGYREAQVDLLLDAVVNVMLAVRQ
ncbi:MAG: DivIVA domain-containing protein [Actinomycetota bacterium]